MILKQAIHVTTAEVTDRSSVVKMVVNAKLSEVKNILIDALEKILQHR
ncbi:MAG: hypothetical protein sL5_06830 [Candidatus Mesenet longicola]|uniref:Uncharacterized protein n=1 Tax=Candidatus Mesenet longicola TaxID=1892558 RepID=A0A8J3MP95_9RICK|nr:MAG: hypothetical protein sGL2_07200 [Candidatus Mesenet longicola]GHM59690.1 MAG: hypothetical protein sL5_06830 [Candidatus Mesenet longicola]